MSESRKPLWLYPGLLGLEAPLVAVAWLYVFAETWRVMFLPWQAYVVLALAVWVVRAMDWLLGASLQAAGGGRHDFVRKHRKFFLTGAVVAGVVAVVLVLTSLPIMIMNYAIGGACMVAVYFALALFSERSPDEVPYGKNILAGMCFSYGTAMLAHLYSGSGAGFASVGIQEVTLGLAEMIRTKWAELATFGVLCAMNISAVEIWAHADRARDQEAKAADELALVFPLALLGGAALLFALLDRQMSARPFFYSILTGAALLYTLSRRRGNLAPDVLRALAGVVLLAPVLVFLAFPRD